MDEIRVEKIAKLMHEETQRFTRRRLGTAGSTVVWDSLSEFARARYLHVAGKLIEALAKEGKSSQP